MKYIIAMIQPDRLEACERELFAAEVNLMTVTPVLGCGRQKGITRIYRGQRESGNLLKKIKLEIAVNDEFVDRTVNALKKAAQTGEIGDGKIFILNLEEVHRIRTDENGSEAIG